MCRINCSGGCPECSPEDHRHVSCDICGINTFDTHVELTESFGYSGYMCTGGFGCSYSLTKPEQSEGERRMNRDEAKGIVRHFEVVKAFAEGKTVQYRSQLTGDWRDSLGTLLGTPTFDSSYEWRVKPEPRVIRLWLYPSGDVAAMRKTWLDEGRDPDKYFTANATLVEFVEVIKP